MDGKPLFQESERMTDRNAVKPVRLPRARGLDPTRAA